MANEADQNNDYGITAKSELLTIAEFHFDNKIRNARGMELLDIYKAESDDKSILELAQNHRLTLDVREATGDHLVDKAIKGNVWTTLAELRDDTLLLPGVRKRAEAAVDAAAGYWIKKYDEAGEHWHLAAMKQRIEQLPLKARGLLVRTLSKYAAEMETAFGSKCKGHMPKVTSQASALQQRKLRQG